MKLSLKSAVEVVTFCTYLSAVSVGNLRLSKRDKQISAKREIDPSISPQQDPSLISSYDQPDQFTGPKIQGFRSDSGVDNLLSDGHRIVKKIQDFVMGNPLEDAEIAEEIDSGVGDLETSDTEPEGILDKTKGFLKLEAPEQDNPIVEQESLKSFVKEKLSKIQNESTEDDDCDGPAETQTPLQTSKGRTETKELENGKTVPDYFDPEMGDGDPNAKDVDDDCGSEADSYQASNVPTTNSLDDMDEDQHEHTLEGEFSPQSVDAPVINSVSEIIPFLRERLFADEGEPVENRGIDCESSGNTLTIPSITYCVIISLFLLYI